MAFEATSIHGWVFVCQGASHAVCSTLTGLDDFFSVIQSVWSKSMTADELSECHKKSFEWQVNVK